MRETSMSSGMGNIPTAEMSRLEMAPDVPAAMRVLKREGAEDLTEMLLGGVA